MKEDWAVFCTCGKGVVKMYVVLCEHWFQDRCESSFDIQGLSAVFSRSSPSPSALFPLSNHQPRLSPAQYTLMLQNCSLKYHSFILSAIFSCFALATFLVFSHLHLSASLSLFLILFLAMEKTTCIFSCSVSLSLSLSLILSLSLSCYGKNP